MKKTMKTSTALIIVVAVAIVVAVLGFVSGGFTNSDVNSWVRERNPDNLLEYTMPLEQYNKGDGTTVDIAKDGTIRVTGEIEEGVNDWSYKLGEVVLPAGTYTLTCSDKCSKTNYIVTGTYTDSAGESKTWYSDITSERTVTFDKQTTVTFSLLIFKDGAVNIEARPVLSQGTKPVDYYVAKTIGD